MKQVKWRESRSERIVREHYGLDRPVTFQEVQDEIANLRRRGPNNLDDRQQLLAAKLNVFELDWQIKAVRY